MARVAGQAAVIRGTVLLMSLKLLAGVRPQSKVLAGVRPQSKVECAVDAGGRPRSKVASDCTLAPDPGAAPERHG